MSRLKAKSLLGMCVLLGSLYFILSVFLFEKQTPIAVTKKSEIIV